jgi:hypothetical protein
MSAFKQLRVAAKGNAPEEILEIEFITDEDYKHNRVYCPWSEITSPTSNASTETSVPEPVTYLHAP